MERIIYPPRKHEREKNERKRAGITSKTPETTSRIQKSEQLKETPKQRQIISANEKNKRGLQFKIKNYEKKKKKTRPKKKSKSDWKKQKKDQKKEKKEALTNLKGN
jgi:hypothetical protein